MAIIKRSTANLELIDVETPAWVEDSTNNEEEVRVASESTTDAKEDEES